MEDSLFGKGLKVVEALLKELSDGVTIVDLPSPIRVLALRRQFELKGEVDSSIQLRSAFRFQNTPEGNDFWMRISSGDYSKFYEMFPREKPADKPTKASEFKNGEEVVVYNHKNCEWIKGKFIGMNDDLFVAWVRGVGFSSYTDCRKIQPKEKEPEKEDKNAFVKNISSEGMEEFSDKIFNNGYAIQILNSATPEDKPELENRAFFISSNYEVEIGKGNKHGTYIAIYKK